MTHELKTHPVPFQSVYCRRKHHEVRKWDRNFQVGDVLHLKEFDQNKGYTGRDVKVLVTYVTAPGSYGLAEDGPGVMSIERMPPEG